MKLSFGVKLGRFCLRSTIWISGSAALERFSAPIIVPLDVSASVFLLLFDSFGDGMEVHLTE